VRAATHYEVLGVPKGADSPTIQRAYRRKASRAHPDRAGGSHQAMVALTQAYETLSDPAKRARYDETGHCGPPPPTLDQVAQQLAMSVFMQVIEQCADSQDHVQGLQIGLAQIVDQTSQQITKLKTMLEVIERRRKRLTFKGKGSDFLAQVLEQRMRDIPPQIAANERQLEAAKRAQVLCNQYEWKPDPAAVQGVWIMGPSTSAW